jgi:hypothetical protein
VTIELLRALARTIERSSEPSDAMPLRQAVHRALRVEPPAGSPVEVGGLATAIERLAARCDHARLSSGTLTRQTLPQVWFGVTAVAATDAASALDRQLRLVTEAFDEGAAVLRTLASTLAQARFRDERGRGPLWTARSLLSVGPPRADFATADLVRRASAEARTGIADLLGAATMARVAGQDAARRLDELGARAHAGRLGTGTFTALDTLAITGAAAPSAASDRLNLILTADAAARADARLGQLEPNQRRQFNDLLAGARSVQERAYLLRALAAGHSLDAISVFATAIHPHGNDPVWLADHLTPAAIELDPAHQRREVPVLTGGVPWSQGDDPTCAATAVVFARARIDPLYALELTTGGHPGDPAQEQGEAFARRLAAEQRRVYDDGRPWLQDMLGVDGMTPGAVTDATNDELGRASGLRFELVDADSIDERRRALADIERTVDAGVPVPIRVADGDSAHRMVILAHDGERLQVYNPWGHTMWITEDDLLNGNLDVLGTGLPGELDDVILPAR